MARTRAPLAGSPAVAPLVVLVYACLLAVPSCGGSGAVEGARSRPAGKARVVKVEYGRLVDVYGFRRTASGPSFGLFLEDVLVGPDIQDERDAGSNLRDDEVLYDFISANPDDLQPRLFIPRDVESREFEQAFDALDDRLPQVTPARFGRLGQTSFPVVPRNAALRLTFSRDLGVDASFFVERDPNGNVIGPRNTEAVQLLEVVGDP